MKSIEKIITNKKKTCILIIIFALTILLFGLFTDVRFSDEVFHLSFAKDWYIKGERPIYNELVNTVVEYKYYRYYASAPLWHYGLKSIFDLTGNFSKSLGQVYMVIWYILLIFGTYLLGKTIYDEKSSLYSVFVISTMPFIVSFSILFFIDVPIAAITPYLIYFIVKRKPVITGIIMGLMFLLKENSYLLLPAVCILLLVNFHNIYPVRLKKRFLHMILFLVLVFAISLPNFKFRLDNFHGILVPYDNGAIITTIGILFKTSYLSIPRISKPEAKPEAKLMSNYLSSPLISFRTFLKYFGVLFPLLFLWRIISILRYKDFYKKEFFIIIPILIYIPLYFVAFQGWWEIRYLSPIIPLLALFSARAISHLKPRNVSIIVLVGLMSFLSTIAFVYKERKLSVSEKEILECIKQQPYGRILSPEVFISYYTQRPMIWEDSFRHSPGLGLYELFWDEKKQKKVFQDYRINYIFVPRKRIYDDAKVKHFGGYPLSFVEKLETEPFIKKICKNEYASIWSVSLSAKHY